MGAGLFITTVVLATVLLVTKGRNYNIGQKQSKTGDVIILVIL